MSSDKRGWLALLLSLTLIRGLIYLSVTPPWQSPDETGHFEYAWLIAHLGLLPTEDTLSPPFERELLNSLYEWRYGEYIGRTLPGQMPARLNDLPSQIFAQHSRTVAAFTLTKTTKDNNSRTTETFPKSFFIPGIPFL